MPELDVVRSFAEKALAIQTPSGDCDNFLWDRCRRLVHNIEVICRLPELTGAGLQIDHFALTVAAYFSDAGLARYLRKEGADIANRMVFPNGNGEDLLELSAKVVAEKLANFIEKTKIETIKKIIIDSGSYLAQTTEAMILSDARNLDDMGAVGIFNEFRRCSLRGKGVSYALKSWKRKKDYRYWQARLNKSFRFQSVRQLAERRLQKAEDIINQLKIETEAEDIEELLVDSVFV